ncbi:MAG: glycosyltransferase family 1 protein [Bacteroidales bacterium]
MIIDNEKKGDSLSIGFDAKRAFFNSSGLGNYSRNLLSALAKNFPGNHYYLFTPKTKNRFILDYDEQFTLIEPNKFIFKLLNSLWRRKFMTNDIKQHKIDIYHGLSHELPVGIEKTGVKSIVTVHDLIFIRFPELYSRPDRKIYTRKIIHACKVSDRIVAISKQTREDLITCLGVEPDKITVIYQGCNPRFWNNCSEEYRIEIRTRYSLPERYILYVGTVEERKNLLSIVQALHVSGINIPLVVVGRKVNPYYRKVLNYITDHRLDKIIFLEGIKNSDLPVIYRDAECFIYLSFVEGFGIPLLEALVSGTPVITTEGGCFAEAAGPGSIYVDPHDPEKIGKAIIKVTSDKDLRDKMIRIGAEYADNFKDEIIARDYMMLYRSIFKNGND